MDLMATILRLPESGVKVGFTGRVPNRFSVMISVSTRARADSPAAARIGSSVSARHV
jgi:hypothetical protein